MDDISLQTLQTEIAELEQKLANKKRQLEEAQNAQKEKSINNLAVTPSEITKYTPSETKITLFRLHSFW